MNGSLLLSLVLALSFPQGKSKSSQEVFSKPASAGKVYDVLSKENNGAPIATVHMPSTAQYGTTHWIFRSRNEAYVSILLNSADKAKAQRVLAKLRADLNGPKGPEIKRTGVDIGTGFAVMRAHTWETDTPRKGIDIMLFRPDGIFSAMVSWENNKESEKDAIELARYFIWTLVPKSGK